MDYYPLHKAGNQEATLVKQAQSGDRSAFDILVRRYRSLLVGVAYMRTTSLDCADDLAQEILARAWQKLPQLQDANAFVPWLKTIAANVCASWHGNNRFNEKLVVDGPTYDGLRDASPSPCESMLQSEQRHAINLAISSLKDVNRLALVMHAIEGYSYQEIARLTGVPPTTVDGRIRRAKAQLKRYLAIVNPELLCTQSRPDSAVEPQQRRKPMTTVVERLDLQDQARAITLFTNRFATLIETGLPAARALTAMGDIPEPYGSGAKAISQLITDSETGKTSTSFSSERMFIDWLHNPDMYPALVQHVSTAIELEKCLLPIRSQGVGKALKSFPELFTQYYIDVIYYGDHAGQLDAALRRLAELLEKHWQFAGRRPHGEDPVLPFLPNYSPTSQDWKDLTVYQQYATRILLLRGFAVALACGVPILRAMRAVAPILPKSIVPVWLEAIQDIQKGDQIITALARMDVLPEFVIQLISIGEELGTLDLTLMKAAELMEYEHGIIFR